MSPEQYSHGVEASLQAQKRDEIVEDVYQRMLDDKFEEGFVENLRASTFRISDIKNLQVENFPDSSRAASDAYNRLFDELSNKGVIEDLRAKYIHDSDEANLPLALLTIIDTSNFPGVQGKIVMDYRAARLEQIRDEPTHEIVFED